MIIMIKVIRSSLMIIHNINKVKAKPYKHKKVLRV
jgi:hypothetical protein